MIMQKKSGDSLLLILAMRQLQVRHTLCDLGVRSNIYTRACCKFAYY